MFKSQGIDQKVIGNIAEAMRSLDSSVWQLQLVKNDPQAVLVYGLLCQVSFNPMVSDAMAFGFMVAYEYLRLEYEREQHHETKLVSAGNGGAELGTISGSKLQD